MARRSSKYMRYARTVRGRYRAGVYRAKRRGFSWSLPLSDYTVLIGKPCHYCTSPLNETGSGLDRKDSREGYTLPNVVPCCDRCNRLKSDDMGEREFKLLIRIMKAVLED